ncbi:MAG: GDSL-type esterase/lipase family protein, partial [Planctomycetota bacterium]|nr:GDSL-type esterase/lipase family protein [Planctomycetota bacterium]
MEGGARIVLSVMGPGPAPISIEWEQGDQGDREDLRDLMYLPDGDLFFRLKPNLAVESSPSSGVYDVFTDGRGYRTALDAPTGGDAGRVLCVGDSCTFGWGAEGAETFPAQLAQRLEGYEVINAGVPGYSSYQGRRFLEIEGWDLEPDVVTFTFGYNDACAAARGGTKRNMPKGESLSDSAYAARLKKPSPIGLVRLVERLKSPKSAPKGKPGKKEKEERSATPRVSAGEFRANLEAVADGCEARGARLVLVVWPLNEIPGEKAVD